MEVLTVKFIFPLLMIYTLLVGCTNRLITREESINLPVAKAGEWIQTTYSYPANDTAWPCPFDSSGTGGALEKAGTLLVGYDHSYHAGTRPFPCSRKLIHIYRSALQFNLSEIKSHAPRVFVTSATLYYQRSPDQKEGRNCGDSLLLATENWEAKEYRKLPEGVLYRAALPFTGPSCGLGGCAIDVTSAVRNWVSGTENPFGFVLKGELETVDNKDNEMCLTRYSNFSLIVNYKYDLVPIFPSDK